MRFTPSSPDAWFGLPRAGGVAYAGHEPWVQNETIRVSRCTVTSIGVITTFIAQANILFGLEYDQERYKKGIRALSEHWSNNLTCNFSHLSVRIGEGLGFVLGWR